MNRAFYSVKVARELSPYIGKDHSVKHNVLLLVGLLKCKFRGQSDPDLYHKWKGMTFVVQVETLAVLC